MPQTTDMMSELLRRGGVRAPAPTPPVADRAPWRSDIASFGDPEKERDALQAGSAIIPNPGRGVLRVRGADRIELLQRLLTQDVSSLEPETCVRSFWLNRKGRIDADIDIVATLDATWLLVDASVAEETRESLDRYVFAEDVEIENLTGDFASLTLGEALGDDLGPKHQALVVRRTVFGEDFVELILPADSCAQLIDTLARDHGAMLCGWEAADRARVEAGSPLFLQDFNRDSLPHETGVLRDRVSFTKGCYLGQEVVARMESLGKPKQQIVSLALDESPEPPIQCGAEVFDDQGKVIGAVTSAVDSDIAPNGAAIFAMVKTAHAAPGNALVVNGSIAVVRDRLAYDG